MNKKIVIIFLITSLSSIFATSMKDNPFELDHGYSQRSESSLFNDPFGKKQIASLAAANDALKAEIAEKNEQLEKEGATKKDWQAIAAIITTTVVAAVGIVLYKNYIQNRPTKKV